MAVLISGAPIRFTACDFSCDSARVAQMRPQCCCMRDPHTRQCVAMTIINITRLFCILEAQEIARSTPDPFPCVGVGSGNETTRFSACNIEKLEMGLGTRLLNAFTTSQFHPLVRAQISRISVNFKLAQIVCTGLSFTYQGLSHRSGCLLGPLIHGHATHL